MRTLEDFEPFVMMYVPYIPKDIIQHSIRESIVEFLRETRIANGVLELETQEKVPDYIMEVPDCRRIVKVNTVEWTVSHCSGRESWEKLRAGEDGAYHIELRRGDYPIIIFADPPKKPHRVRIDYAWTIGRDDCDIPEFVYEDYMKAIVAGALIRMAGLPDQQILAQQLQVYQATWFDMVQRAKMEKSGGRARRIIGSPILARRGRSIWR